MYDWGMTDDELAHELRSLIPLPPKRYRNARLLLARQAALREAGARHRAYFRKYQARLIQDAGEMIRTSPKWAKYRR